MNILAEEFGFLVLYPAQARGTGTNRCWNWFRTEDQSRGAGEPALIADLTRRVILETGSDPSGTYVAGLSAGASTALILAAAYPDIFAAVGSHSGLPAGAARDRTSALVAMRYGAPGARRSDPMPTISFHGDADRVVNPRNGRFVASRALEPYGDLTGTPRDGRAKGGREYTRTTYRIGKGRSIVESWVVDGTAHAWSGGAAAGGFTDPAGPDASREMIRFFMRHRTTAKRRSTPPADG
jgi:poly(hydroxyalkanoate) depolymerase family esterase